MAYTAEDLAVASKVAYLDIDYDLINDYIDNSEVGGLKLAEYQNILRERVSHYSGEASDYAAEALSQLDKIMDSDPKYGEWTIKGVKDDNSQSGLYGCLIETSPDSAIVGFRGSESHNAAQLQKDWVEADLGLLNSTATKQQEVAQAYMQEIAEFGRYSNYAVTGHSLGGNLAIHAGLTCPDDMKDKITQIVNLDGPGFSDEYLQEHATRIAEMAGVITHYQWSVVGALLFSIPGSTYMSIKTTDDVYGKNDIDSLIKKHDTDYIHFDKQGNVIPGEMDPLAKSVGHLSRQIESCPDWLGNSLVWGIGKLVAMASSEKSSTGSVLIASFAALALVGSVPIATVIGVVAVVTAVAGMWINPEFFGKTLIPFLANSLSASIDVAKAVADGLSSIIRTALSLASLSLEMVNTIVDGVMSAIISLVSWGKDLLGSRHRHASVEPIEVNTHKLRFYAERLTALNRRIMNLDRRLDSLYTRVDLVDLFSLVKADALTGYSGRLSRCSNYLSSAALDFERAESALLGRLK